MAYDPGAAYFAQWANFKPADGSLGVDANGYGPQPTGGPGYQPPSPYFAKWSGFQPAPGAESDRTPVTPKRYMTPWLRAQAARNGGMLTQPGTGYQSPMGQPAQGQQPSGQGMFQGLPQGLNTNSLGDFYSPHPPGQAQQVGNSTVGANFLGGSYAPRMRTF